MRASQQSGFPRLAYGNHGSLPTSDSQTTLLIIAKARRRGPGLGQSLRGYRLPLPGDRGAQSAALVFQPRLRFVRGLSIA
ncbi:hypothetical protein C4K18_2666 [Pseudomonas chlororaphis subsp. aurantiaca]|nr:hypothetical protein C4K18_2666 [Pseudomonas chlororaphis subsp. aurantiaca]